MKIRSGSGFCSSIILYVGAAWALAAMASCSADGGTGGGGNGNGNGASNGNGAGNGNRAGNGPGPFAGNTGFPTAGSGPNGTGGSGSFPQAGATFGGSAGTGFGGSFGGTPAGGAAGSASAGAAGAVSAGGVTGYFKSGTWKGFGFTSTFGTATIMPPNFAGVANWPMCATGSVPPGAGLSGALVGWNVNQESTANAPTGTITPTRDGIVVGITNRSNTQLRLQIQGPTGATVATQRWCAEIGASSSENIFVDYDSFKTECWAGAKNPIPYKGEPISQVIVQVADTTAKQDFNFCVNNIGEGAAGTGGGGMGCDLNSKVNGTAQEGTMKSDMRLNRVPANVGNPQLMVQNNIFNPVGSYTINYKGSSFSVADFTGSALPTGAPIGYPSLFIGSNGGDGRATTGSNLPKQVSTITSIPTALRWSGNGTAFNIAYDVWFSDTPGDNGPGTRRFLMVWFHQAGGVQAEGQGMMRSGGMFSIGQRNFNVYVSRQFENRPIVSYVATSSMPEWSFDLADFIRDAKTRRSSAEPEVITDSHYLTNIFAGTEVWSGSNGVAINNFCIQVR